MLFFELLEIVASWTLFGEPISIVSGMAVGISDNRPQLYPARLAWLTETGVTDSDHRALVLELWAVLDRERLECATQRLSKQLEESRKK